MTSPFVGLATALAVTLLAACAARGGGSASGADATRAASPSASPRVPAQATNPTPVLPPQATPAPPTPAPPPPAPVVSAPAHVPPSAVPAGVPIAAPKAPPQIIAIAIDPPELKSGATARMTVTTSSNVASVELRASTFGQSMVRQQIGTFTFSYFIPPLPPLVPRTFQLSFIARNAAGVSVTRSLPVTIH